MSYNNDSILSHVKNTIELSVKAKQEFWATSTEKVVQAASWMAETVKKDGRVLIMGNGGSAADAQHMAAEMVGRMLIERKKPLSAIALTTDTSCLTAIGNDYSYDDIFDLQVKAHARAGDLVIAISTSGNSKNVIKAARSAKQMGARVISMSGGSGGELSSIADLTLNVSLGKNSSMIQETHISVVHMLVDLMDRFMLGDDYVRLGK